VNLYFGEVTWEGSEFYLLLSHDANSQVSSGDFVYSPNFSVYDVADESYSSTYTADDGSWTVGHNWINGSIPLNVPVGNYSIKAFDAIANVAVTDTFIAVYTLVHDSTLVISPSSGPGGVPVQFTGSNYPRNVSVNILYYDPTFGSWNLWATTTSDSSGNIIVNSVMPDLGKSVGAGDCSETYASISFRTEIKGIVYCYADYNQYSRGLKTVGTQTAFGLYGNGTNLSSTIKVEVGDKITLSGKWFHPSDVIYVKWDGVPVVGTVTGEQWNTTAYINSTITNSVGSFDIDITIPFASAGEHFIAIEDSETLVIVKILVYQGSLHVSPSSGPGGAYVEFTGSGYPSDSTVTISSYDSAFDTWNPCGSTTADASGRITFTMEMPDLRKSLRDYDSYEQYTTLSFRTEVTDIVYNFVDYNQYWRGLKRVGNQVATGLHGNGTRFNTTLSVNAGDSLTISGKWFHPGDVIYVKWDGVAVVGTVTADEWRDATIIGTSIAGSTGSFETTATIPTADVGEHYVSIEDSETRVIITIYLASSHTPSPTPTPTPAPTPTPQPTPTPTPDPSKATPTLDVSCKGTAISSTEFKVEIKGKLSYNGGAISGEQILISYSVTGGDEWESLTSVNTGSDGGFVVVWTPSSTGDKLVKARWAGNASFNEAITTVNLALAPYSEQTMFSVNSNSTISEFAFNSTTKQLSFTASGPSDTTGYVTVYIPKSLINDISDLTVYVDETQITYSSESQTDSWILSFTYSHSTHKIVIDLSAASSETDETPADFTLIIIIAIAIVVAVAAATLILKRKR
jgi:hypothetical protein